MLLGLAQYSSDKRLTLTMQMCSVNGEKGKVQGLKLLCTVFKKQLDINRQEPGNSYYRRYSQD